MIKMNYGTVSRVIDVQGPAGCAWRLPLAPPGQRTHPDFDATVDGWLLHVPGAHLCWSYWMLAVVHLRPIPGVRPPHINRLGDTHELLIAAINPEKPLPDLEAVGRGEAGFEWLSPVDVVEQFQVNDDAQAARVAELAVRACVDGMASPDQDWRSWWRRAIADTARHFREGRHPEARA